MLVASYKWQSSEADTGLSLTISDLGHGTETSFSKIMENLKLGRTVNTLEGRAALQRDLDKYQEWADANFMKFNRSKSEVLCLGWS